MDLPALSPQATARIRAAEAKAEDELGVEVTKFFQGCKKPSFVEEELGRKPFSVDLVPFFQQYATAVFEAAALELLEDIDSAEDFRSQLRILRQAIVDRIAAEHGVWRRVVAYSCQSVDMGAWSSQYGFYGPSDFLRPHRIPIRGALSLCMKRCEKWAWDQRAERMAGQPPGERTEAAQESEAVQQTYKTLLGKNIDRLRRECRWSYDEIEFRADIDRTQVLDHINKGTRPRRSTLQKYADAFSEALKRTVTVSELLS
jgi:hypothetical protein